MLSPVKGTMQPLNRIRKLSRDAHEEEYLKLRAMGHIFKVRRADRVAVEPRLAKGRQQLVYGP